MSTVVEKPRRIPVGEMVPPGSIGAERIAQIPDLGRRFRPETTFNQSLKTLWPLSKALLAELQSRGMSIVSDALSLSDDQLSSFAKKFRLREKLQEYLKGLLLTPHARVLEAALGVVQHPVPPEREDELVGAVDEKVTTLPESQQTVLRLRFGLDDGIRRTLKEIGSLEHRERKVERERIRVIEERALGNLRSFSRRKDLTAYFSLPEESLGREFLRAVFEKDLPEFPYLSVGNLDLSDVTKEEVANISKDSLGDLVKVNLQDVILSREARGELGNELKKVADKYYREQEEKDRQRKKEEQKSELEIQRLLMEWKSRLPINNLIPEIILTSEQMNLLKSMLLSELGLHSRTYNLINRELKPKIPFLIKDLVGENISVADLLSFSREDLANIRKIGKVTMVELGKKLGDKLEQLLVQKGIGSQVTLIFERQAAKQIMEAENKSQILLMRNRLKEANNQGLNTVEQIHEWLTRRDKRIFGIDTNSWIVRAMIEYVLNHPAD